MSSMTPKQAKKMQNKREAELQRLRAIERRAKGHVQFQQNAASGVLSKGQRRRANAQKKKGVGEHPHGYAASSSGGSASFAASQWPSGHQTKPAKTVSVQEDEFIQDIRGSDDFRATRFAINPGLVGTFPWLSTVASRFERYRFRQLEFYYKPLVSGFADAGRTGKVMLSCDYDANDPTPGTKQQVEDTYPHSDCMPYEVVGMFLSPQELTGSDRKLIRTGAVPAGGNIQLYDGGALFVSTQGNTGVDPRLGEIRVRYVVELSVPVLENPEPPPLLNTQTFHGVANSSIPVDGTPAGIQTWTSTSVGGPGIAIDSESLSLPRGNWLISYTTYFQIQFNPAETQPFQTQFFQQSTLSLDDRVDYLWFPSAGTVDGPLIHGQGTCQFLASVAVAGTLWTPKFSWVVDQPETLEFNNVTCNVVIQAVV